MSGKRRLSRPMRRALRQSQREAVGSSVMSAVVDNYLAAFALFLNATAQQVAWIVAVPQLLGTWGQVLSVWLAGHGARRLVLIVGGAAFQSATIGALIVICATRPEHAVYLLLVTALLFQFAGNLVQPQWRAVMVLLVPQDRRGRYFARRSRVTALTSFAALTVGGLVLHLADRAGITASGFGVLFACALAGRVWSTRLLATLSPFAGAGDDPQPTPKRILAAIRASWADRDFRQFTLFLACMQGAVAVAGPLFSVHMLRNLGFSYVEFMASLAASVLMQLVTLTSWGYVTDHLGNRIVLVTTAFLIPTLPLLWIFSGDFWYLVGVQALAGLAWGGFTLSSGNYLYDLRPSGADLARFAALQSVISGIAIFSGALLGGALVARLPTVIELGGISVHLSSSLYGVFAISAALRFAVALWFTPRVVEMRLSPDATVNQVIVRLARFNPVTGAVIDFVGSVRRRPPPGDDDSDPGNS